MSMPTLRYPKWKRNAEKCTFQKYTTVNKYAF